jgi:hypothetical protein
VQVHHDEGVASHIGPEPCASLCEEAGEASAGERIGQPLSRESYMILGADALQTAEGHMDGRAIASACTARRGRRPWHVQKLLEREPGGPTSGRQGYAVPVRIGKVRSRSR